MTVSAKLFGFVFWLFSLNCAQCQECLQKNITYENIMPVAKASYGDSETVKVTCMTGFTGMYKLKCEKGTWKTVSERPCAKKKCSHPGDIENGDFKLKVGSEFVFGATVLYTCNKGFEMTSRINQRTCRAQGWDNTLPVCEALKCPAIHTDGGVTAIGNTEEAIYGDAIHFKCVSTDKKIDGSSEIHCTETGQWSDPVPTCKDITCTAPDIKNGYIVEKMQEYQKDARLKYRCVKGFKLREGIPICSKYGWTLKPECDEVTCELKSTTVGIEKIKPEGKTVFRAGESVEITCSERYWYFFTKETTKSFKCKDEGEWDSDPVCEEIKCEVPHDQHVSRPQSYFIGDMKLGATKYYSCMSDYEETAAVATCTRDGWTPKPLCTVKMCAAPNIANADIVGEWRPKYQIYSRIQYKCHPGFEPKQPVQITCNHQTVWTGIQQCTEMCGPPPNVDFAKNKKMTKNEYSSGERVEYSCLKTYMLEEPDSKYLTCEQGQWRGKIKCLRTCELKSTTVGIEKIKPEGKTVFRAGESVEITCSERYWYVFTKETTKSFKCKDEGEWDSDPVCEEIKCEVPHDQHVSRPQSYFIGDMKFGATKYYSCMSDYEETATEATCTRDGWTPKPLCTVKMCAAPNIANADIVGEWRPKYQIYSRIQYKCHPGFEPEQPVQISCNHQTVWTGIQQCTEMCGPPPNVDFAQKTKKTKNEYRSGERFEYSCLETYKLEEPDSNYLTCEQGQWRGNIKCLKMCGPPPYVNFAKPTKMTEVKYSSGERVEYSCLETYTLEEPDSKYLTCEQGQWRGNIMCLKPCSVTMEEMNKRGIKLQWGRQKDILAKHKDSISFVCQDGKYLKVNGLRQSCNDGVMALPECV
ncbi:complement factor H-like isoform X2 [Pseudorasbora parva]|uniref:complement factor H-like isoform X2 n=1 Tax=Pseudorasbora parva TaxID=51549 RepID=UPI00351F7D31